MESGVEKVEVLDQQFKQLIYIYIEAKSERDVLLLA